MKSTSKKGARPTTKALNDDPDPLGFGTTLAEIIAELKDAYRARLHAFLRVFLLVRLAPAVLRTIFDAATTQGGPVSFDLRITVYPRNALGFFRVVGALKTPPAELSDDDWPDEESDAPEQYVTTIFGKQVPASLLKTGRGRGVRRR
jgi:hypothetical protein